MKYFKEELSAFIFGSLAMLFILHIGLGDTLLNLNSIQFDMSGDGLKNYFTFAYHYQYGTGLNFEGLLYPYGDMAIYADCQILVVWGLQFLRFLGLDLQQYLLAILNGLPILSAIVAVYALYRIFRFYKLPYLISVVSAVVCISLSPQLFRLQAHYALSYSSLFPVYFLGLLYYVKKANNYLLGLLMLYVFLAGLIHPYYVLQLSMFSLLLGIYYLSTRSSKSLSILLLAIIPLIVFLLFLKGFDSVHDRPENPFGLMQYKTEVSDLLPFYGWFHQLFDKSLNLRNSFHEGYSYLGSLLIMAPFLFVVNQYKLRRYKINSNSKAVYTKALKPFIAVSLVMLLFAMGVHLFFAGKLLDLIPPLKQFRTLGRFSWPFYYIGFMFLVVWFFQLLSQIKNVQIKSGIYALILILWGTDIYGYHKQFNQQHIKYRSEDVLKNRTEIKDLLSEKNRIPDEFQAVLTLPGSSVGVEKIAFPEEFWNKIYGMSFAQQTGIPLTSCHMSRVSISNALKILQITNDNGRNKTILEDFKSKKPLLILIPNHRVEEFSEFLASAEFIGKNKDVSIYDLSLKQLALDEQRGKIPLDNFQSLDSLSTQKPKSFASGEFIYFDDFEQHAKKNSPGLLSKYALSTHGIDIDLADFQVDLLEDVVVEVSFWYRIQAKKTDIPLFDVKILGAKGQIEVSEEFRDWDFKKVEIFDQWIQLYKEFSVAPGKKRIQLLAHSKYLILDHLLIKTRDIHLYKFSDDSTKVFIDHDLFEYQ